MLIFFGQSGLFHKMLSSGFLNTSQYPVMGMSLFSTDKYSYTELFSEHPLWSEGNKTVQQASFFIPFSMFITPWWAKISKFIDSFFLLWYKRESNAKNDTWPHPVTWYGFCFKCCQTELFSSLFLCIFCAIFLIRPTTVMFLKYNSTNSLDKVAGGIHYFSLPISWVHHWTEIVVEFFLS